MPSKFGSGSIYALYALFLAIEIYISGFLERTDTTPLLLAYSGLFLLYLYIIKRQHSISRDVLIFIVLTRGCLLFFEPNLSDDFYRFIWDGRLMHEGIDPFLMSPKELIHSHIEVVGITDELYAQLNSQNYFTIYPPISQLIFMIGVSIFPNHIDGSILIIKLIIILADFGTIYLLFLMLQHSKHRIRWVLVYALNPLVIIELTGNLHFEAIVICFLLAGILCLTQKKWFWAAISLGLSIATKLIPLMLLPGLIRKFNIKTLLLIYMVIGIVTIGIFLLAFDPIFVLGMTESLELFFQKFEFNSGIFFLLREIGFVIHGYDIIAQLGPALALTAIEFILIYALLSERKNNSIPLIFVTILFIQLSLATTVHPWYIIPMLAMGCLCNLWFPVVWSFLIFLTYSGYDTNGFDHPYQIMTIEYIIVLPMAIIELFSAHKFQLLNK